MKKSMIRNPKTTAVLTALLVAGMATTPVMAAGTTYEPVNGGSTTFTKTIKMKATAKVPNVTFKYAVEAGAAQPASDGNLAVLAGTGLPTIKDVTFTANEEKPGDGTSVTKTATVDFSKVSYKEPGVYRYVITESGSAQGLSTTEDQQRHWMFM